MTFLKRIFTLDLRSLALCRVATGLVILVDLVLRALEFRMFYTDRGILPRLALFESNPPTFPVIHMASDMVLFQAALFVVHGLCALALLLGYRTRWATLACWYFWHSLMTRNFLVNNGGDAVMVCLLFWAMFLPWGERASLDALVRPSTRTHVLSIGTVGLVSQIVLIYLVSVYHKMEPSWLSGQAVYYALQSDLYSHPSRIWLLPHPDLLKALTWGTLVWETLGALMLLSPWPGVRGLACVLFTFMHWSFGFFLRLGTFAFTPTLNMMALLPGTVWTHARSLPRVEELGRRLNARLRTPDPGPFWLPTELTGPLVVLILFSWLSGIGNENRGGPNRIMPASLEWVGDWTGLRQRWAVFVHLPENSDGWVLLQGQLEDGSEVDLFQGRDPFTWKKPVVVSELHPSFRWPTPLVIITGSKHLQPWFVQAMTLAWDDAHPTRKVVRARFYYFQEPTLAYYQDSNPTSTLLLDWMVRR